ncbi:biotin synthase BioB [Spirochaetia bacterium 38H-sp]|uniref:Biotin synthase n=1 Tax=Rarispira pelagica TaxID=3141764 RepID=A0ABU9UC02_9SPIR
MERLFLKEIRERAEKGEPISFELGLDVLNASSDVLPDIFAVTNALRIRHFGNRVNLCSIVNARSGACTEDCAFCAQSAYHKTEIDVYPLRGRDGIVDVYNKVDSTLPVNHFGVVTSGEALTDDELDNVISAISHKSRVNWCASLGTLSMEQLLSLKKSGLKRFHHNLETSPDYFSKICTTHSYEERLRTVQNAKQAGLEVCCGGIFGLGEGFEDRVSFALLLNELGVDAIPINFLVPVKGTRLENQPVMKPFDILRSIAMLRLVNPSTEIKVCAGRLLLGDLQSAIFWAGASGMMIGDLLTIAGRSVTEDIAMLDALGLIPVSAPVMCDN